MANNDNVISFRDSVGSGRLGFRIAREHQRLVDILRDEFGEAIGQLATGVIQKLDDALYRLSERGVGTADHEEYFCSMRELRIKRVEIGQQFKDAALNAYTLFWRLGPQALERDDNELKLLEQDELEESLALEEITAKAEKRFQDQIESLNRRFSQILGGAEVRSSNNPLAPGLLAHAFCKGLRSFDSDLRIKLIAYKLFGQLFEQEIGDLYSEFNSRLHYGGVLPGLSSRRTAAPAPRPTERATVEADSAGRGENQSGDIFAALQSLMRQHRHRREDEPGCLMTPPTGTEIPHNQLVQALGELQRSSAASWLFTHDLSVLRGASVKGDLHKVLVQEAGTGKPRLREADLDIIDMVSMLFDFVLDEKSLPDAMKAQLARLQVPMLKLALMDHSFFRRKGHPARQLLNQLARLAFTWADDGDRSESSLYGRIDSLVSRVLVEFEEDPGVFETVSVELRQFLERERQAARMAEERTRQVSQGKEQLLMARRRVDREISSWLDARPELPEVVQSLLRDGWKDVLLLTYLRQGAGSVQWREAVALIEKLLWSVEPKPDRASRNQLLSAIPNLLAGLRKGLDGIAYDKARVAKLFKDLQAVHILCLRGQPASKPADGAGVAPGSGETATPSVSLLSDDRFNECADALSVGSWVEIRARDGTRTRAKLSWRSEGSDVYVFVNRKGVKVRELSIAELAELMRKGQASVLEDPQIPLVERALVAMMKTMREDAESEGLRPGH